MAADAASTLAEVSIRVRSSKSSGRIGPVEEEVPVLLRDAHQRRDGLQRQLRWRRRRGSRNAPSRPRRRAARRSGRRGPPLIFAQALRAHRRGDEAADLLVARVVLHVEEHAGGEPEGQILDQRAAAVTIAAADRGEQRFPFFAAHATSRTGSGTRTPRRRVWWASARASGRAPRRAGAGRASCGGPGRRDPDSVIFGGRPWSPSPSSSRTRRTVRCQKCKERRSGLVSVTARRCRVGIVRGGRPHAPLPDPRHRRCVLAPGRSPRPARRSPPERAARATPLARRPRTARRPPPRPPPVTSPAPDLTRRLA